MERKDHIKRMGVFATAIRRDKNAMVTITMAQLMNEQHNILDELLTKDDKHQFKKDLRNFIDLGKKIIVKTEMIESALIDHENNKDNDELAQEMVNVSMIVESIMDNMKDIPNHCYQSLENDIQAIFNKYKSYKID